MVNVFPMLSSQDSDIHELQQAIVSLHTRLDSFLYRCIGLSASGDIDTWQEGFIRELARDNAQYREDALSKLCMDARTTRSTNLNLKMQGHLAEVARMSNVLCRDINELSRLGERPLIKDAPLTAEVEHYKSALFSLQNTERLLREIYSGITGPLRLLGMPQIEFNQLIAALRAFVAPDADTVGVLCRITEEIDSLRSDRTTSLGTMTSALSCLSNYWRTGVPIAEDLKTNVLQEMRVLHDRIQDHASIQADLVSQLVELRNTAELAPGILTTKEGGAVPIHALLKCMETYKMVEARILDLLEVYKGWHVLIDSSLQRKGKMHGVANRRARPTE